MAKAYWICTYRSINDPDALVAYGKLAGPAVQAFGGRMTARAVPAITYQGPAPARVVILEFDSVKHAMDAHASSAYQAALQALGTANERDLVIVEGIE